MSAVVLVVEDEPDLLRALEFGLRREGYLVRAAGDGEAALAAARASPAPDLVLLDLMLPDLPGTEVCRRLRAEEATKATPVIMLTARGEEIDRVVGFEVGADDYVVKPFSMRELLLRIRAVLRRQPAAMASSAAPRLQHGPIDVDLHGHRVWISGEEVHMTALEFRLLQTLVERRGRVQSREQLLADVWGYAPHVTTRTVDTHVKRLRAKLGDAGALIETVRSVGYLVRLESAAGSAR